GPWTVCRAGEWLRVDPEAPPGRTGPEGPTRRRSAGWRRAGAERGGWGGGRGRRAGRGAAGSAGGLVGRVQGVRVATRRRLRAGHPGRTRSRQRTMPARRPVGRGKGWGGVGRRAGTSDGLRGGRHGDHAGGLVGEGRAVPVAVPPDVGEAGGGEEPGDLGGGAEAERVLLLAPGFASAPAERLVADPGHGVEAPAHPDLGAVRE